MMKPTRRKQAQAPPGSAPKTLPNASSYNHLHPKQDRELLRGRVENKENKETEQWL